jgi:serine/threonine protein kinase, bacterial
VTLADGEVFAGYRIVRSLGNGGMGEVYLARHPRLPRRDALKVLRADVSADPDYRARFEREADLASTLWHPHIVAVHDRGDSDGRLWITMDFVDGTDAAALMQRRYPYGMPLPDVLDIASGVADALDYAHEQHLLHRDVKPANILLTESRSGKRRILLADFGIARLVHDTSGLTATGMTLGSVGYAAPEQLTGSALDGRADQYALACTAFHLLSGRPPFANSNPAVVIGNHLSAPPPPLSSLRADLAALDAVLQRAMAKRPSNRFPSCHTFAAALAAAGAGLNSPNEPTQPAMNSSAKQQNPPPATTSSAHRRAKMVLGAVGALLVVALVAYFSARLGQPSPQPQPSAASPAPTQPASQPPQSSEARTDSNAPLTPSDAPPRPTSYTPPAPPPNGGDLGLSQPISKPACNGQGIVILGSVTTPGEYADGVRRLLAAHPGALYLRTDQTCPSLRAATEDGNPIYAVYRLGGRTEAQVCAAVRRSGGDAYGKWLNSTTDPEERITC